MLNFLCVCGKLPLSSWTDLCWCNIEKMKLPCRCPSVIQSVFCVPLLPPWWCSDWLQPAAHSHTQLPLNSSGHTRTYWRCCCFCVGASDSAGMWQLMHAFVFFNHSFIASSFKLFAGVLTLLACTVSEWTLSCSWSSQRKCWLHFTYCPPFTSVLVQFVFLVQ